MEEALDLSEDRLLNECKYMYIIEKIKLYYVYGFCVERGKSRWPTVTETGSCDGCPYRLLFVYVTTMYRV